MPNESAAASPPSGRQLALRSGRFAAVVTEVGAGLRELTRDGQPVIWSYPESEIAGGGRGQVLAPWPNRLQDGTYSFGGTCGQAALDEPARRNAIHGLVRWLTWRVEEHSAGRTRLSCELAPQPAYPWRIVVTVTYELGDDGLAVTMAATNLSGEAAPFGGGFHPYLHTGAGRVDGCRLVLGARRRLLLDERGLPTGWEEIAGTAYDFSLGRQLAGIRLDDCFTGLGPAALPPGGAGGAGGGPPVPDDAAWTAELHRGDGRVSALWADGHWPYLMCFTADTLAGPDRRGAVALEPMTCPPNALRSGEGLIALGPGEAWSGRFGISQGP